MFFKMSFGGDCEGVSDSALWFWVAGVAGGGCDGVMMRDEMTDDDPGECHCSD